METSAPEAVAAVDNVPPPPSSSTTTATTDTVAATTQNQPSVPAKPIDPAVKDIMDALNAENNAALQKTLGILQGKTAGTMCIYVHVD